MPIKKKKNHSFRKFLLWLLVATLVVLMLISFSTTQHLTEIVVYP